MRVPDVLAPLANWAEQKAFEYSRWRNVSGLAIWKNDEINNPSGMPFPKFVEQAQKWSRPMEYDGQGVFEMKMHLPGENRDRIVRARVESGFFRQGKPILIYHHPLNDYKYKNTEEMLVRGLPHDINLISIVAQEHTDGKTFAENGFDSLKHMEATMAGSVLMAESITQFGKRMGSETAFVGVSIGGMVAAWHWLLYGSCDKYFPLVASVNVGKTFMEGGLGNLVDQRSERSLNDVYASTFAVDSLTPKGSRDNIFPVLGKGDDTVPYAIASDDWSKLGVKMKTFLFGHFTPGLVDDEIREFIEGKLGWQTQKR